MTKRVWTIGFSRADKNDPSRTVIDWENIAYAARLNEDVLRNQGSIARLVELQLRRGQQPSLDDLVAALRERTSKEEPVSPEITEAIVQALRRTRKSGRPASRTWTPAEELGIVAVYYHELECATIANRRCTREAVARRATAQRFHIEERTVARIVASSPWKPANNQND